MSDNDDLGIIFSDSPYSVTNEDGNNNNDIFYWNFFSENEIKTEYWLCSEITGKPEPFYPAWKRNVFRLDFFHLLACLKIRSFYYRESSFFTSKL
jgi:hypothetical protein